MLPSSIRDTAVTRTDEFPDFPGWTWNDDHNYFGRRLLWLGTRNTETNDARVVTLDLDTLEIVQPDSGGKGR